MSALACPYCYSRINGAKLWFQCNGRGSPGRPGCKPARDPERERLTGFTEPARPVFAPGRGPTSPRQAPCPSCGAVTGIRACPACHTPLPATFGASASPLIAMVGAKGTGKSVYLTILAHELLTTVRQRFDADVRLSGDAQGGATSPRQWLDNNVEQVYRRHRLFAATEQARDGRREPLVFEWRHEHRRAGLLPQVRTSFLSFYDTAGEDLTRAGTTQDLAYLGAADSLILLLDPFRLPRVRDHLHVPAAVMSDEPMLEVLGRITETLRQSHGTKRNKRITQPIAVAFAKIDALFGLLGSDHPLLTAPPALPAYDETAGRATHEHIRALLHEWGGDDIDALLRHSYATFRYFAVSALGAPPDYDKGEVDARGVRPHRVEEPLMWLLSRSGVVPAREQR